MVHAFQSPLVVTAKSQRHRIPFTPAKRELTFLMTGWNTENTKEEIFL